MSRQIQGATAVVTGGQKGLGKAIVDELLARGAAKVYATSRRPEPSTDPRVVVVEAEVTDGDSVARLAALAGDATIVVNNAGVTGGKSLLHSDLGEIRSVLETNLFGPLLVTRAFAPQLAGGTLVNVASVLSWLPGFGAYGFSKAALWSVTNSLRAELSEQDTNVVGVYLGYTDTPMVADLDVPKNDPADVARQIVDGIESGAAEVLADELTRQVRTNAFA
ncbi:MULTISPECIES: SDR family oxidoreductase [Mycolicibacterium]|jgi:NAD(P)-dependent dehydrogenase (short-subunit alcohol dehydrogenase family)|uniref:Short-chain dehydrogenase n=3 Tax=Mycolicibacterium TaxID=1866885 RepID=A0A378T100_9MYCO|nr:MULTISPECIES: SDR family oxidoreductase [Mycolicibacterium]KLI08874.1 short-chain dehydrogenase [Mycolicibacterium senegalense]KLO48565.1 short-chain dehydrogenase [Mycolicibacterium senegalense]KMV20284.1 short-chain dehydrogenase [Mycolicibacterium conceptionense]MCV7338341.1 SDR family oxidoreductase [Mycolicibacterium senegalense]MCW1823057.1 SDR family oxidoreductase [Mycolicibacterium senegalense]